MLNSLVTFDIACLFLPSNVFPPCALALLGVPCACECCSQ